MATKAKKTIKEKSTFPKKEKSTRTKKSNKYTSSLQASLIEQLQEQLNNTLAELARVKKEISDTKARIENLG